VQVMLTLGPDQRSVAADARAAEEQGFDGVAWGEHLFFHGAVANSFVTLAAAAGATSRIRLLSSVTILPLYPAVLAAKLATTLDQVSGGRFDFGVGVGGEFPHEFTAAGVSVRTRGRRTDEHLELCGEPGQGLRAEVRELVDRKVRLCQPVGTAQGSVDT
jgi:alkanesulfonate monooxygenase SsuD/methylene tetrahydromethanopterin reductase-like flavin-dependent oxidoreductase (luciferase family)